MSHDHSRIQLAHLLRELKAAYPDAPALAFQTYRSVYARVLNGDIPAQQAGPRGPWTVAVADLPRIAEMLGVQAEPEPTRSRRTASSSRVAAA
ncbi:MAG TPA: hypothetical protein VHL31_18300 [Geminicoccus sp.]|jgi:hypothetical protein|uniref:hypothetical protein n=1 Tax=Geminicoccus sp. TaxID=2024832 RepID=UPI002E331E17|nr:hypothetical protein [Geminicoccus sp.]HEX2528241.1 hypothetical protein [Geminicoccus sp.]